MKKMWASAAVLLVSAGFVASVGVAQPEGRPQRPDSLQPAGADQWISRMMQRDADGDGKLSKAEMADTPLAANFDRMDTNSDGFIDRAEIETMLAERANRPNRPGAGQPAAEGEVATFDANMSQAGRALRRLGRSEFTAESRAADLAAVQQLQSALTAAKAQIETVPMSTAAKERFGDDQATYQTEFRVHLIKALQEALAIDLAVTQGNAAAATAARVRLQEVQSRAHDLFEEEDEG